TNGDNLPVKVADLFYHPRSSDGRPVQQPHRHVAGGGVPPYQVRFAVPVHITDPDNLPVQVGDLRYHPRSSDGRPVQQPHRHPANAPSYVRSLCLPPPPASGLSLSPPPPPRRGGCRPPIPGPLRRPPSLHQWRQSAS